MQINRINQGLDNIAVKFPVVMHRNNMRNKIITRCRNSSEIKSKSRIKRQKQLIT